ncbi:TMEM165/GDT1 family protein [Thioalkalivibrio sp.]|uniref:TMEM165/GDT1 family protein n=1 Tax=Thioalkalivibrio sp. TaxID=2093813 RepID=UPI00356B031D
MEIFLLALFTVAIAEIGDKTQFITLTLSARFRRPWPVFWGVFVASAANHGLAAVAGMWVSRLLPDHVIAWIVGLGFLAMAAWTLQGDHEGERPPAVSVRGAFFTTFVLFFLMEMGDKTQVATAALAANFETVAWVVAGSTLGMVVANAPAIWIGHRYATRIPARLMQRLSAGIFAFIGIWVLIVAFWNHAGA